ncbi:unnamed protein product [Boreogadus saida]
MQLESCWLALTTTIISTDLPGERLTALFGTEKSTNKSPGSGSLYTLKQEKDYSYIKDLQSEILQKKFLGGCAKEKNIKAY